MKVHTDDSVLVISGKDRGKVGKVIRVLPETMRVVVDGVNIRTKHIRKSHDRAGQIVRFEGSIAASAVMLLDPRDGKPTRVGYRIDPATGAKVRVARRSGSVIERGAPPEIAEQTSREESATQPKLGALAGLKKTPFWKRALGIGPRGSEEAGEGAERADIHPTTSVARRSRESS